jgi:hypothetical protein
MFVKDNKTNKMIMPNNAMLLSLYFVVFFVLTGGAGSASSLTAESHRRRVPSLAGQWARKQG